MKNQYFKKKTKLDTTDLNEIYYINVKKYASRYNEYFATYYKKTKKKKVFEKSASNCFIL